MNKIGVHALTFIGDIENHSIESCLSRVAKIGYDVMELPLLNPDALDFSWWDYRIPLKRNVGMRIDHILITGSLLKNLKKQISTFLHLPK